MDPSIPSSSCSSIGLKLLGSTLAISHSRAYSQGCSFFPHRKQLSPRAPSISFWNHPTASFPHLSSQLKTPSLFSSGISLQCHLLSGFPATLSRLQFFLKLASSSSCSYHSHYSEWILIDPSIPSSSCSSIGLKPLGGTLAFSRFRAYNQGSSFSPHPLLLERLFMFVDEGKALLLGWAAPCSRDGEIASA
ncbi:hypothetical protein KSP40_PGU000483 [Platanthera guangdongensis]|uniref:Uncharacterized protein n=1 Tax=Platanthera guangdongensis TaxID=2320717 RepID=A0ABR2MHP6_9ASPA